MTDTQTVPAAPPTPMTSIKVRLGDLGLAPENVRFKEPADDGVPQLAETILAAGVVIPPIVRPGRKGEQRFMALDGRRRLGLLLLRERGDLTDDYEIDCLVAETKAQQVAGVMLPATEHAPVHIADAITAIGKLRKTKLDTGGHRCRPGLRRAGDQAAGGPAAVHPNVPKALRAGKLTLKQVRLFARIGDKKQQAEIAQTALDGYFQDYQLKGLVTRGRVTVDDPRFTLVGMDRYVAAGGRVSSDLFAELPDALRSGDPVGGLARPRAAHRGAPAGRGPGRLSRRRRRLRGAGRLLPPALCLSCPDLTEAQTTALNEAITGSPSCPPRCRTSILRRTRRPGVRPPGQRHGRRRRRSTQPLQDRRGDPVAGGVRLRHRGELLLGPAAGQ
ncbi:ParB N-terminal domain-containing protein [Phenylobacterium sp. J367]|uniref:ParB N-terminal domain-containing protein n=1 Tax=Phenylobacterium sp. J367 TaxID=2898435 RepID=UPI002150924F|nr:ParB N-terminal domain-containing protein [Phenylobacterium sp. J367]MCR5881329.1 ParB N-terminal domain-containing protein [Phenylobacterium sp. J367]